MRDFAVGQAGVLVEIDHGGLHIRTDLASGSAGGVGSLQRMPTLARSAAVLALATVDVELPDDWSAGNLGLILMLDARFLHVAATVRASVRQRGFMDLVDAVRGRRLAMAMPAMAFAGFA